MVTIGSLYVIGLPIGAPTDISLRALEVLKSVDIVAAEDTREFKGLASFHNLSPQRVFAHHDHNQRESTLELIKELKNGLSVALVSDAGTPNISDPGGNIVSQCHAEGIRVITIPGPSALTASISVSPFQTNGAHSFFAFPPKKTSDRLKLFKSLANRPESLIFYEAPHRMIEHIKDAKTVFKDRDVALFRELTKKYEEVLFGRFEQIESHLKNHPPKGEFVVQYSPLKKMVFDEKTLKIKTTDLLKAGMTTNQIAKELSPNSHLSKSELYQLIEKWKTH